MSNVLRMVLAPPADGARATQSRRLAAELDRGIRPREHAQRAAELSSPEHRLMLAKTLRKIERSAGERAIGPTNILDLAA